MRVATPVATTLLVLALTACGQESGPTSEAAGDEGASRTVPDPDRAGPPALTLLRPEGDVDLEPYTWCFPDDSGAAGCADGARPADPPTTSAAGSVSFTFPLDGWSFTASFREPGERTGCERTWQTPVRSEGDGTYVVPALGPVGHWEVDISGYADAGGDLFAAFGWTMATASTEAAVARGEVGLLGPPSVYEDRDLEAYGPTLYLSGLAEEPADVFADVVLSDGTASATYALHASRQDACRDDGAVALEGDDPNRALDLPALGEPPYSHEVHLTMDGRTYVGTGTWPDDLTPRTSNQLALTWTPALPAWDPASAR
jgi:hypothetical protein